MSTFSKIDIFYILIIYNTINNHIDLILSLCYNLVVDNTGMYVISKEVK